MKDNNYYMERAIKLALKAKGKTSPNPLVGALVVKDGRIVGEGYHQQAGLPHAEIIALDEAGRRAEGATLFVTLEPCVHFGRTPPCVNRIIKSKIKKVVIGMRDPNPLNNGKGIEILRKNKISVECGFREDVLREINEVFIKYITQKIPYVTVKVAQSLDGKIATSTGDSKWVTSDASRNYAHRLRQYFDAVMVGVNTILRDDPLLSCRLPGFAKKQPLRIIVDSHLSTPQNAKIFQSEGKVIIATLKSPRGQEPANRQILSQKATILEVREVNGQVNLYDLMKKLAKMEITNILVEGGGTLIGSLFDEALVDKVMFFISPKIIGGREAISSVEGKGIRQLIKAPVLKDMVFKKIDNDILIEGRIEYHR
ncbi:MAG: bifunctional diaminohydroxyphosphoribosylaminopyrimidine deaminase/5-amino-6-(5-phosphoribosylamino)uracil reductase RibD [Candidatus Omnitrophica bacterium]|nr:bifunctional diaminohydroxyphosphoribosylaminopyrimidine deaminase/5-amino-6-(5-phosphoribosylamino)uracil reductase RibD [Candidatus Omnitrophota bacterium]MCM8771422.1 bifunctional diaminohydroxyphosphoribosylaminopyrimidine deaminase/5-amino-6-(5-phosphoribosylamino)uracil reductase RibD [Candidatus Omnitrophota bacterium]